MKFRKPTTARSSASIPLAFIVFFLLEILLHYPLPSTAQQLFQLYEDTLEIRAKEIQTGDNDFTRFHASELFTETLLKALKEENSLSYPFDSLETISRLVSPDEKIRIFSWVIRRNDGSFDYSGVLQIKDNKGKGSRIYQLEDHSQDIEHPEKQILTPDNWYGALYYELIQQSSGSKVYYTLLAWDGNNSLSHKKIIEVLSFQGKGKPVFGAMIFSKYPGKVKRVIFEYSAKSSMSLNYGEQRYETLVKKGKKKVKKKTEAELIVFDRLNPLNEALKGQYQYYVPESNVQDGFLFEKGRWTFIREVDARNLKWKPKKLKNAPLDLNLFPPPPMEK